MEHLEGTEARKGMWNNIGEPKESEGQRPGKVYPFLQTYIYLGNVVKFRGTQLSYFLYVFQVYLLKNKTHSPFQTPRPGRWKASISPIPVSGAVY